MRAFVLDGYGAIADHVRLARGRPDARQGGVESEVTNYSLASAIAWTWRP